MRISAIRKKDYIRNLIIMIIVMAIFVNSYYWPTSDMSSRRIIEWCIVLFGIIIIPIALSCIKCFNNYLDNIISSIADYTKNNLKTIVVNIVIYLAVIALSYIIEFVIGRFIYKGSFNQLRLIIVLAFNSIVFFLTIIRNKVGEHPEYVFGIIAIITGLTIINVSPSIVGVSWDDEIHYARTLSLANAFNGVYYTADEKNILEYGKNITERTGYTKESRESYQGELDSLYANKKLSKASEQYRGIGLVCYIPSAIGVVIARGLGLSYTHIFMMGRFFNLLNYVVLFYFAIKKIRYGKILVAAIGLIPTSLFMASSYSYDSWIIGFTVLGFSYLFTAIKEDDEKECKKELITGTLAIVIGCLFKAIYFPLVLIGGFIAFTKLKNKKIRNIVVIIAVVTCLLLLCSFLIPTIMSPNGNADLRAGDVNAKEQIMFILRNPLSYAGILLNFLKTYLSLESAGYFQLFAYMGQAGYWGIVLVTIIVLAILDRDSHCSNYRLVRCFGLLMVVACMILVPTALYAAYTPVASETINGCQYRYLLPTIFPLLYLIMPDGVTVKYNKKLFVVVPLMIITTTILSALYNLCAACYV